MRIVKDLDGLKDIWKLIGIVGCQLSLGISKDWCGMKVVGGLPRVGMARARIV